jgi:Archaea-specific RecJ-like exonuclease, contains DnaJ-type Zn finger domain
MHRQACIGLAALLALGLLCGCQSALASPNAKTAAIPAAEVSNAFAEQTPAASASLPADASPGDAAEAIYALFPDTAATQLTAERLEALTGIAGAPDFAAYYSDAKYGLADLMIVAVDDDTRESVRDLLYRYKETRVAEFENYDILDSFAIAQGTVVYDQGDYLVLLMLPDNAAAQQIIDQYIPL